MICSLSIDSQKDGNDVTRWVLRVVVVDLETAERLAKPILEELDKHLELIALINE